MQDSMRNVFILCALGLGLASCGEPTLGDENFAGPVEDRAALIAANLQPAVPANLGDYTVTGVQAQGREVILKIETDLGYVSGISPFELTKHMRAPMCNDGYRGFIEAGGVVRVDFSDPKTGSTLPPGRVASCHGV